MANSIEYFGVVYDERTDWRTFLREALHGGLYRGLNVDRHVGLNLHDALGELADALRGTPMEIGLADAALEVIEHGKQQDMDAVESAGWQKAPEAFERMLALVERAARTLPAPWLDRLYGELFRLNPEDPRLLATFVRDAQGRGATWTARSPRGGGGRDGGEDG